MKPISVVRHRDQTWIVLDLSDATVIDGRATVKLDTLSLVHFAGKVNSAVGGALIWRQFPPAVVEGEAEISAAT